MKRIVAALGLALLAAFSQVVAASEDEEVLTNEDLVALTEAGLPLSVIFAKMAATPSDFDITVEQLVALAAAGVAPEVIVAMIEATTEAVVVGLQPPDEAALAHPFETVTTPELAADANARMPGTVFRDTLRSGGEGPAMVVVPAGKFRMGCLSMDDGCFDSEMPVREVTIPQAFALSAHEVTFDDYDRFTYPNEADDEGWDRGRQPVINVSWEEAREYVAWLSAETGEEYRLPTEAEWEYAARAGSEADFSWGDEIGENRANCDGCGSQWDDERTATVGSFAPNGFGLHDMHGNVWEWVGDCWNESYAGAPSDGGAWRSGDCSVRVMRGGSWSNSTRNLRAALRVFGATGERSSSVGFRVARTLAPVARTRTP